MCPKKYMKFISLKSRFVKREEKERGGGGERLKEKETQKRER